MNAPVHPIHLQPAAGTAISRLLAERQAGHSLPAGLYTRADVFDADMKVFFQNQWISVGLECEIPEAGDSVVQDIGKSSIILLRDDDMQVRAFHNVCRHRGARVLNEGKHVLSKLSCPYHQWTYELDGSLLRAPHMGVDFDKSCKSLKQIAVKSIGGMIYVCLSDKPPADVSHLEQAMEARLAPYGLREAKVAYQMDVVEKGNWKLTMENNRECYHCGANHPELCVSFIDLDFGYDAQGMNAEKRQAAERHEADFAAKTRAWEAEGHASTTIERLSPDCDTNFRTQRLAIAGGGESHTLDARAECAKLMGSMTRKDLGDTHLWGHNGWNHFMGDHAVVATVIPLSADETLVRTKWLVHRDAVEGVDYDVKRLTAVWIATTQQDADLVARSHAGASDPSYEPGPYSAFAERELDRFCSWYVQKLQDHGY